MEGLMDKLKAYLRVDGDEENELLRELYSASCGLVADVLRVESIEEYLDNPKVDMAVFYAVAYMYEHREEADHRLLMLNLRALLSSLREGVF